MPKRIAKGEQQLLNNPETDRKQEP